MASRAWRTQGKANLITIRRTDGSVKVVGPREFEKAPYWRSSEWRALKRAVLRRDRGRCACCKRARGDADPRLRGDHKVILEVHHLTYERFGREHMDDLLTLCRRCHSTEHQWIARVKRVRAA